MTPRLQFIISFIIFILSPMCLFIGYKKTDKEMNDTEQKINILIKKNALIEAIGEDFLYSSTPNPNQGESCALPINTISLRLRAVRCLRLSLALNLIKRRR